MWGTTGLFTILQQDEIEAFQARNNSDEWTMLVLCLALLGLVWKICCVGGQKESMLPLCIEALVPHCLMEITRMMIVEKKEE
jgi:hypothetical protein